MHLGSGRLAKGLKFSFGKKHSSSKQQMNKAEEDVSTSDDHKEESAEIPQQQQQQPETQQQQHIEDNNSQQQQQQQQTHHQQNNKEDVTKEESNDHRLESSSSSSLNAPSSARRRWILLSNKVMHNAKITNQQQQQQQPGQLDHNYEYYKDDFKSFGFFALSSFGEQSSNGVWYRLVSSHIDTPLDVHFLNDHQRIALKDLVGYDNTGNVRLWPSEECLAEYLLLNPNICLHKDVLELGAGMIGLAGLVALLVGAKNVFLTDGNERSVKNLEMIIERNELDKRSIKSALLDWSGERLEEKFDVILCADCLFYTNSHQALLGCIHAHLKRGGHAYIMAPSRRGTAMQFLNQLFMERYRWNNIRLLFHYENEIELRIKLFDNDNNYEADLHTPILFIFQK